jgi:putative FmdB family regulatory protein
MPIYAYRCAACGHAKDVLQKMSDPVLSTCPACGAEAFHKQLTAAGFQLKGSGWYVTDFRGGNTVAAPDTDAAASEAKADAPAAAPAAGTPATPGTDSAAAKPAAAAPAAPAAPTAPAAAIAPKASSQGNA